MSEEQQEDLETASESRREALKRFGRYAAVATPAMLMLLDSNRQEAMAAYNQYDTSKPVSHPKKKKKWVYKKKRYSWRWRRRYD